MTLEIARFHAEDVASFGEVDVAEGRPVESDVDRFRREDLADRISRSAPEGESARASAFRARLVELVLEGRVWPRRGKTVNRTAVASWFGLTRNQMLDIAEIRQIAKEWFEELPLSTNNEINHKHVPVVRSVEELLARKIAERVPLLRYQSSRPYASLHAIAHELRIDPKRITRVGGPLRKIVGKAIRDNPWLLSDELWVDPNKVKKGELQHRVALVVGAAAEYLTEKSFLPQGSRPNNYDIGLLAKLAGVELAGLSTSPSLNRKLRDLGKGFPILPHGFQRSMPGCYRDLQSHGITALLRRLGRDEDSAVQQIRNFKTRLKRWMTYKGADLLSGFDGHFDNLEVDLAISGYAAGTSQQRGYAAEIRHLAAESLTLLPPSNLPLTFKDRFSQIVDVRLVDLEELSGRLDIPFKLLRSWRNGNMTPSVADFPMLKQLEREFSLAPRTFTGCFSNIPRARRAARPDVFKDVNHNVWRYMPEHAPFDWEEERVWKEIERIETEVLRQPRTYSYVGHSPENKVGDLVALDETWPIMREWHAYTKWKRRDTVTFPRRRPRTRWKEGTLDIKKNMFHMFVRWLATPRELGGAGCDPLRMSMAQLVNSVLPQAFCRWRAHRAATVTFRGECRGVLYTESETGFLIMCAELLNKKYGWLAQQGSTFAQRLVVSEETLPWPHETSDALRVEDDEDDWKQDWAGEGNVSDLQDEVLEASDLMLMSSRLIEAARRDWVQACQTAEIDLRDAHIEMCEKVKRGRDVYVPIMPILRHDQPLGAFLKMIDVAFRNLPRSGRRRYQKLRDVAIMMGFAITAFRSRNLRELTWYADNSGQLRRLGDGYEVEIDSDDFKNAENLEIFGDRGARRSYHRILPPWKLAKEIFDLWLDEGRTEFLTVRLKDGTKKVLSSNLMFPSPDGGEYEADELGRIVRSFTRYYCVRSSRHPFGMKGVMAFSPHAIREIIATHIVRTSSDPNRFAEAADLLQTSEPLIRRKYAWVSSTERFAKCDQVFARAFDLVATGADLY